MVTSPNNLKNIQNTIILEVVLKFRATFVLMHILLKKDQVGNENKI
jgi:hypothetical protein